MQENTTYQQSLGALGGSIVGLWRTTTVPHQGVTMRQHAYAWVGRLLLGLLITLAMSATTVTNADPKFIHVNCNDGKTLKQALHRVDPGDTIRVIGTCTERVTITTDRITLVGSGSAVLDGGGGGPKVFESVVTIDGARGVTIRGFTFQNSPGWGIHGKGGAAFAVKDTTMQDYGSGGLFLNSSSAELTDVVVQRSGAIGIAVQNNSTAVLRGNISSTESMSNGITVQSGSTVEIRGASVQSTNNRRGGVASWTPRSSFSGTRNRRGAHS